MKEVWIMKLRNIQRNEEDATEINLDTEIEYEVMSNGVRRIAYLEADESGMGGCISELLITPDNTVTLVRTGTFGTSLVVSPGREIFCDYQTPFGNVSFTVRGRYVRNHLTDEGGALEMCYAVYMNSGMMTENLILLRIERQKI
ncbi:MAG: DUF1934 domain-containing protein [Oscillospiraceae bacterium]|nr:DUF1934 domain-containing protein [Oscillospiraceae bacterium]